MPIFFVVNIPIILDDSDTYRPIWAWSWWFGHWCSCMGRCCRCIRRWVIVRPGWRREPVVGL